MSKWIIKVKHGFLNAMNVITVFRKIGHLAWKAGPIIFIGMLLIIVVSGTTPALELWALGKVVDQLTYLPKMFPETLTSTLSYLTPTLIWIGLFITLRLMQSIANYMSRWSQSSLEETMTYHIQSDVLTKASHVPFAFYEQSHFYDQLQRSNEGMGLRFKNLLYDIVQVMQDIVIITGLIILSIQAHWLIPVLILAARVPILLMQSKYNVDQYKMVYGHTPDNRMMNYVGHLLSGRDAAKEVRLFGVGSYLTNQWANTYHRIRQEVFQQAVRQRIRLGIVSIFDALSFGGCLFLIVWGLSVGRVSIGEAVVIFYAVIRMQTVWEWTINRLGHIHQNYLRFARDLFQFLESPVKMEQEPAKELRDSRYVNDHKDSTPQAVTYHRQAKSIKVEQVSFTYPNSTSPVLKDIQFEMKPGEKVALVGENGAGKSTLVKILLGLYTPSQGEILVNGIPLSTINKKDWWTDVSAVFQEYAKYHVTLRENIGYGQLNDLNNNVKVMNAARLGGADSMITESEKGLDQMLGPTFGGRDISGGQWQKIAISRGYIREAPFIILDEPNAALDPQAEKEVYARFQEMAGERTALLISHRIGFARLADRILVLKEGKLIENGTHSQLKRAQGEYAKLLAMQSKSYQEEMYE